MFPYPNKEAYYLPSVLQPSFYHPSLVPIEHFVMSSFPENRNKSSMDEAIALSWSVISNSIRLILKFC